MSEVEATCLSGCRLRVLHFLQSKPGLLLISVLVVVECLCVLALMIAEIQLLRLQVESDRQHIIKYQTYLKSMYGSKDLPKMSNIQHVISFLFENVDIASLKPYRAQPKSVRQPVDDGEAFLLTKNRYVSNDRKDRAPPSVMLTENSEGHQIHTKNSPPTEQDNLHITINQSECRTSKVFVIQLSGDKDEMFVVAELDSKRNYTYTFRTEEARTIQRVKILSGSLSLAGIVVMSMMLAEIIIRIFCKGRGFFKRKFEVFDAAIVLVSFSVDVAFLDDSWYKAATDATTILILLLPWRLVRIIYSMISTLNNKHQLHVRELKDARDRTEVRLKKAKNILLQSERDVECLILLCRRKGANENEIKSCQGTTGSHVRLATLSTFSSMVLVSAPVFPETELVTHGDKKEDIRQFFSEDDDMDINNNAADKAKGHSFYTRQEVTGISVTSSKNSMVSGKWTCSTYL